MNRREKSSNFVWRKFSSLRQSVPTYLHTHKHTYIHTYIYVHMYTHMYIYKFMHTHHICTVILTHIYMYTYMHMYVCTYCFYFFSLSLFFCSSDVKCHEHFLKANIETRVNHRMRCSQKFAETRLPTVKARRGIG
jgi:hypothetical protein